MSYRRTTSKTTKRSTSKSTSTLIGGPLPSSGAMSMSAIRSAFVMSGTVSLSNFRGKGSPALPSSGAIAFSNFRSVRVYRNTTTSWTTSWTTRYTTTWNCACNCDCTCFHADTLVWMADGTKKRIADVKIGDKLMDGYGGISEVLFYDRPTLSGRPMYRINGDYLNTADHLTWTEKGWAVIDKQAYCQHEYGAMVECIDAEGNVLKKKYVGVRPENVSEYWVGTRLGYRGGYKKITSIEKVDTFSYDHMVYALVTNGNRTFMVGDGYVVSGWANDEEVDYSKFGRPTTLMGRIIHRIRKALL